MSLATNTGWKGDTMIKFKRLAAFATLAVAAMVPSAAMASEGGVRLDRSPNEVKDMASLQAGARNFVNYCLGCHSASMMRYNRLRDIGLTDTQIKDNLLFTADKVGELMNNAMTRKDAKEWFGAAPPDLSVIARSRGADWLYTYMRTFYRDPASATGWNNMVFDRVGMPHVLWTLSGQSVLEVKEFKTHEQAEAALMQAKSFSVVEEAGEGASKKYLVKSTRLETPGSMTPVEYNVFVRDLVNFLVWMGEPAQLARKQIGIVVLFFLGLLILLTWLLKKEFWKDVH